MGTFSHSFDDKATIKDMIALMKREGYNSIVKVLRTKPLIILEFGKE